MCLIFCTSSPAHRQRPAGSPLNVNKKKKNKKTKNNLTFHKQKKLSSNFAIVHEEILEKLSLFCFKE